ncbi:MAG: hypothetical protein ACM3ZE_17815 [Myxococcales bacterium]
MSAPKPNVLDALGAVSGLGRPAVDSILTEVRANLAKLDACPRHEFAGVKETAAGPAKDGSYLFRDYRCSRCGGKVDSHAARWYRLGLDHAKGGTK